MSNTSWGTLSHVVRTKHSTGRRPLRHQTSLPWPSQPPHLPFRGSLVNSSIHKSPQDIEWSVGSLGQTEILTHWGRACTPDRLLETGHVSGPNYCLTGNRTLEHSQDMNAFLRPWMRKRRASVWALCLDTFPYTSEGTPKAHTSTATLRFE